MRLTNLNRYQAFASHLAISLVIFGIILLCITHYWYTGILFDTSNGWKAVSLIIGIDLILGPLLTLIVFNPTKPSLKFDLTIIGLIQVLALIYGTWTIYSSRPLAIAYINTSFITLYANAENAKEVKEKVKSLKTNQLFYVFDKSKPNSKLNMNQLEAYSSHAKSVPSINSPYTKLSGTANNFLIAIDPLASTGRYIAINKDSGNIESFHKIVPIAAKIK